jgi:hypothetical protein
MKHWLITDKGDSWVLRLVDGRRVSQRVLDLCTLDLRKQVPDAPAVEALDISEHYSRQNPGTRSCTRNGQNLVFISEDKLTTWISFRPTPGVAVRPDGHDVWECALFRCEGAWREKRLASTLIREAVELTCALWGPPPERREILKRIKVIDSVGGRSRVRFEDRRVTTGGIITYIKPEAVSSGLPGYCYRRAGWRHIGESRDGKPMLRAPQLASIPDWRAWDFHGERGGKLRAELCGGVR